MSVEEYLGEPRYEHCEYIDGQVVELNLGGAREAAIRANLCGALAPHLRKRGSGHVFARLYCRLRVSGVERFYLPDVSAAAAGGYDFRFHDGAPDLVVEIRSPGDPLRWILAKVEHYFANGAKLAWVVLPEEKAVLVCRPDAPAHPASSGEALDGGTLIPGLTVPVDELFD